MKNSTLLTSKVQILLLFFVCVESSDLFRKEFAQKNSYLQRESVGENRFIAIVRKQPISHLPVQYFFICNN